MLSFFRRGITAKIMLAVLALGLFAIVITGFGTGSDMSALGGGGGGATIAEAGDEDITATEVSDQVNRQLTRAREQNPELDIGTFFAGGAFEAIVRELISQEALISFARNLGFTASEKMVNSEIASIPAFHNLAGQFDNATYRQALAAQNITEQALRDEISSSLIQQQVLAPLAASARVPEALAFHYASLLLERRAGSIGLVPTSAMPQGPAPSANELANYYQQNRTRYMVPERRVIRYAAFGPEQLGAAAQPTEAEIAAFYRANGARYAAQETRDLLRVVFPSQQAAQQFSAKIARGVPFEQAAAEAGFGKGDITLSNQSRGQLSSVASPAVANAVFGAAQGSVTQPIQSPFGWQVVRVQKINRTPARPLSAVRGEIAQQLGAQKREQALGDLITRIEDALAEGASIEEVARANRLSLQETPPVTATGAAQNGQLPADIAPLLKTAFEMEADEDPVVEPIAGGQKFAVVQIGRIIPAAPAPLAEIRDRVQADLMTRRASERARAVAQSILAKINAGTPPAQAFAQAGVRLAPPQNVNARRIEIAQGNQVPPPLQMMFSMKKGTAKLLAAPQGRGWFVVHLAQTEPGSAKDQPALVQMTRAQFNQVVGNEYVSQFLRAVELHEQVERDEDAINSLKRQLLGPGSR